MKYSVDYLDKLPIHFILCTERTGSSLLSLMLNLHPNILSPSEEPFALYFWGKYRNKTNWDENDLICYVDSFFLIAEKNTSLYFSKRAVFIKNLLANKEILNFERLIKITYLHFLDIKDKSQITCIVDKQIKYFFHLHLLRQIFPSSKYIVLTRDVRDNIVSKSNRKLNWNQHPYFLAALWNDTYENIKNLQNQSYITISYESLMRNPEVVLRKICDFLGYSFDPKMLETDGVYDNFLKQKKNDVDPEFLVQLQNFHSGLSQKPNLTKIGQYKHALDQKLLDEIENICGKHLQNFNYETNNLKNRKNSIKVFYYIFLSKCYRRYLLSGYYFLPLWLKLKIKKWRSKKPVV